MPFLKGAEQLYHFYNDCRIITSFMNDKNQNYPQQKRLTKSKYKLFLSDLITLMLFFSYN